MGGHGEKVASPKTHTAGALISHSHPPGPHDDTFVQATLSAVFRDGSPSKYTRLRWDSWREAQPGGSQPEARAVPSATSLLGSPKPAGLTLEPEFFHLQNGANGTVSEMSANEPNTHYSSWPVTANETRPSSLLLIMTKCYGILSTQWAQRCFLLTCQPH